jgi:AcrR family transcriptional regulator
MSQALATQTPSPAAQERINHIIEAASAVLAAQGYANTSIKDIAREAGIAQGLVHYYFGSKEELVLAVLRQTCGEMLEETRRSFNESQGHPLARAWAGLQAAEKRSSERPELFRLMLEMVPLSQTNRALRAQLQDLYENLCAEVTEMIDELNEQLPTPLPIPARDFAGVVVAAIDGLAIRGLVDPDADPSALYGALGFLLLSSMTSSYAVAGLPLPPVEPLAGVLGDQPAPGDDEAPSSDRR